MGDESAAFATARNRRVDFAQGLLDFGFETVFSHKSNADFLEALKTLGYEVHLYFVCTEDPRIMSTG
jgi:predicted ABC-type ATPase